MEIKSPTTNINPAKLKEARGNRSPQAVADAIGISRQHLWQIENGKRSPGSAILTKLCWLYDLELSDLTNGFSKQRVA